MSAHELSAELSAVRQVELLEMAEGLAHDLEHAPVERIKGRLYVSQGDRGVAKATFSNVVLFLGQGADLPQLSEFLHHLDDLDPMTAQNRKSSKAEHRALRSILIRWLRAHNELNRQEIHFVWAWTKRILPSPETTR